MKAESQSSSQLLTSLLYGMPRRGTVLNRSNLAFGDYVISITAPGEPRQPNGVECKVAVPQSARVTAGRGALVIGRIAIQPGKPWNPLPAFGHVESLPAGPEPLASALSAWGTDPEIPGEPLVAGYVAGLVLLHSQRKRAEQIVLRAARQAGALTATLLRHAALGEVPEPVHDLLVRGDAAPLLGYGSAGLLWLRGLISAGLPFDPTTGLLESAQRTPALQHR